MDNLGHNSIISAYNPFKAVIDTQKEEASTKAFDYATKEGNREARSYVHGLRKIKAEIEATRKKEKAESLEYGKRVDEQAKLLQGQLEELMLPHTKELERLEQLELERKQALIERVAKIRRAADAVDRQWATLPVDAMQGKLDELANDPFHPDSWQEFALEAKSEAALAMGMIRKGLELRAEKDKNDVELAQLREAQAKRDEQLADERRLRDKQEQEERDARELANRNAQAKRDEEAARLKAEQDQRDLIAAEQQAETQRQLDAAKAAQELAERNAKAAQDRADKAEQDAAEATKRAERAAETERQRLLNEEQDRQDQEKRRLADEAEAVRQQEWAETQRVAARSQAIAVMVDHLGPKDEDIIQDIMGLIEAGKIPHVRFIIGEQHAAV